jgi:hypothetical protein
MPELVMLGVGYLLEIVLQEWFLCLQHTVIFSLELLESKIDWI